MPFPLRYMLTLHSLDSIMTASLQCETSTSRRYPRRLVHTGSRFPKTRCGDDKRKAHNIWVRSRCSAKQYDAYTHFVYYIIVLRVYIFLRFYACACIMYTNNNNNNNIHGGCLRPTEGLYCRVQYIIVCDVCV